MERFEKLYDESEKAKVRFVGFTTDSNRYDFGIIYSNLFFGKPLVVCMQTGRSTLLDPKDLEDVEYIQSAFRIHDVNQVEDLIDFFKLILPSVPFQPQYE